MWRLSNSSTKCDKSTFALRDGLGDLAALLDAEVLSSGSDPGIHGDRHADGALTEAGFDRGGVGGQLACDDLGVQVSVFGVGLQARNRDHAAVASILAAYIVRSRSVLI